MNGEVMIGTCQVCGKQDVPLTRKYYRYAIKCECHSPEHFEIVEHCKDCIPTEPESVTIEINTGELRKLTTLAEVGKLSVHVGCEHRYEYLGSDSIGRDILKCIHCGQTTTVQ